MIQALPKSVIYLVSILGGLLIWEALTYDAAAALIAPPSQVLMRLAVDLLEGPLLLALINSLGHLVVGFALSVVVAVPLGLLIGRSRSISAMTEPVITAIYAIPPIALVPFLLIWFGLFFEARVALVFVMSFFEILVTVSAGARNVEPALISVGRAFGSSRLQLFCYVILPASLPFIFAGLRVGLVRAVNAMITAELFFAAVNLGAMMKRSAQAFDPAGILAIIVMLCLRGLAAQEGLKSLEHRLLPWHLQR